MKLTAVVTLLLLVAGCVSVGDFQILQDRVTALEKSRRPDAKSAMVLATQAGARKFWWRDALTGTGGLDELTGMSNGDAALVMTLSSTTASGYMYVYDADGTNTTSSPERIKGSTAGAWHLVNFYAQLLSSEGAADGEHYISVTNTGAFSGTPSTGQCYYRQDTNSWCCYDSNDGGWLCEVLTTP